MWSIGSFFLKANFLCNVTEISHRVTEKKLSEKLNSLLKIILVQSQQYMPIMYAFQLRKKSFVVNLKLVAENC